MSFFGPRHYQVPRLGEHGRLSCFLGKHWWTLVRQTSGLPLGVICAVCKKTLKVHDIGTMMEEDA